MRYQMRNTIKGIEFTLVEIRKIQMVIMEELVEFDRICRKYDISYSIDGGTMLGAVRHKGFIPWDLDADIVIMRKDYDRFKEACESDLDKNRFFLQDYTTDPYYLWAYSRLLRRGTSFIRAGYERLKARNGVFLDIFIMDYVPDHQIARILHRGTCFFIQKALWSKVGKNTHPNAPMRAWLHFVSLLPRNSIFAFRNVVAAFCAKNENSELVRHMCSPHPKRLPYGFPRRLFDELSDYSFEGHKFLGFSDYDFYLQSIYGDYMMLPPEEDRNPHIPFSSYQLPEAYS